MKNNNLSLKILKILVTLETCYHYVVGTYVNYYLLYKTHKKNI